MQIGIVLAIKTLADRFEPLNEVYRDFTDEAVLAEALGFDFVSTSEHLAAPRRCRRSAS